MCNEDGKRLVTRQAAAAMLSLGALAAGALSHGAAANGAASDPQGPVRLNQIVAQFDNAFTPGVVADDGDGGPGMIEWGAGEVGDGEPGID